MKGCCHGISRADLLYNRFSDDASCCPATCFVSQEPCRCAHIHGSFTSSQHFKNKHITINQSKTPKTAHAQSERGACLHVSNCSETQQRHRERLDAAQRFVRPALVVSSCPWPSTCDSDEVPQLDVFGSSVKNEAISFRRSGRALGRRRWWACEGLPLLPACTTAALTGRSILIEARSVQHLFQTTFYSPKWHPHQFMSKRARHRKVERVRNKDSEMMQENH